MDAQGLGGFMLKYSRRKLLRFAAGGAVLPTLTRISWQKVNPTRPITLIVFVGPGGAPDIKARILAQALSPTAPSARSCRQPARRRRTSRPADGRTRASGRRHLALPVATPHAVNATLHEQVTVVRDIAPVAGITGDPFVMVVNPSFPAKTLRSFFLMM